MRRTLMYVGRTGHRLQSRLLQLLEQPEISTVAFVSIKLDELIWVMFQVEGPCARVLRLHAKILGLHGVDLCTEKQAASPCIQKAAADAIGLLRFATNLKSRPDRETRTFRGLQ
jgi:hypothetical protein